MHYLIKKINTVSVGLTPITALEGAIVGPRTEN